MFRANEVRLIDENVAKNDGQLMQCIYAGSIQIAEIGGDFCDYETFLKSKQPVNPVEVSVAAPLMAPVMTPVVIQEVQKPTTKKTATFEKKPVPDRNVASDEVVMEARKNAKRQSLKEDTEPKNTVPVVMFGEVPQRRNTNVNSEHPMPDYVNPDDIIAFDEDNPLTGDRQAGDIIYADNEERIDLGAEGIVDARTK
jgi:hypothetical protein